MGQSKGIRPWPAQDADTDSGRPAPDKPVPEVIRAISKETGLKALTETEFKEMSARWKMFHTPISFVVGLIVGIGFVIGVSGQTFYTFVLENTRHLGTLKAMDVRMHYKII
ncbi:MAG: hypothetical protein HY881_16320 [Deltaproteobacteria bacterium]|nr:hypothetical protein [Deltaproteobacteria bacterium]